MKYYKDDNEMLVVQFNTGNHLVNIIECMISIWLYVSVCCLYIYVAYAGTIRLSNPG
jgi:hypothetical protein